MESISIENMFKSKVNTNLVSDKAATIQNLKLLLETSKGELFGDPYFGTNLKKMLFDQNDIVFEDLIIDEIYTAITVFIPQIKVNRADIVISKKGRASILVTLKALNRLTYTTDLYNIVLFSENA